jgi:hypothetical protein
LKIFIAQIHHEAKVEEEKRKNLCARAQNRTHSDTAGNSALRPKEKLDARKLQVLLKQRHSTNIGQTRPVGWEGGIKPTESDEGKTEKLDARKLQILLKLREHRESFKDRNTFIFGREEKQPARITQAGPSITKQQHQFAGRGKYTQEQQEMDELAAVRLRTMLIADGLIEDGDLEV